MSTIIEKAEKQAEKIVREAKEEQAVMDMLKGETPSFIHIYPLYGFSGSIDFGSKYSEMTF